MNSQVDNHGGSTETSTNKSKKCWRKLLELGLNWSSYKERDRWLDKMRGTMSVVAIFIATITFQMALNPPGGVRAVKDNANRFGTYDDAYANPPGTNDAYAHPPGATTAVLLFCDGQGGDADLCPGEAVLAVIYPDAYFKFLLWNTICFIASLSVCLMLVTGIRFSHRFFMWLLSIGMCFTLTTLVVTYIMAVSMVTPVSVWGKAEKLLEKLLYVWIGLFCFFALLLTLRIIIWGIYDFRECKKATTPMIAPA